MGDGTHSHKPEDLSVILRRREPSPEGCLFYPESRRGTCLPYPQIIAKENKHILYRFLWYQKWSLWYQVPVQQRSCPHFWYEGGFLSNLLTSEPVIEKVTDEPCQGLYLVMILSSPLKTVEILNVGIGVLTGCIH